MSKTVFFQWEQRSKKSSVNSKSFKINMIQSMLKSHSLYFQMMFDMLPEHLLLNSTHMMPLNSEFFHNYIIYFILLYYLNIILVYSTFPTLLMKLVGIWTWIWKTTSIIWEMVLTWKKWSKMPEVILKFWKPISHGQMMMMLI